MNGQELHNLLRAALNEPGRRLDKIKQFQKAVFDGSQAALSLTETEWDVLTQLAQDLDYYEPDPEMRREDATFFGDERVTDEIREALGKLHVQV